MLKERDLIALIAAGRSGAPPREGDVGIGDDCAVLRIGGRSMLITIDMMVEGIHFDLDYTPPYLLGRKAVAACLSDIAAMGGTPRAVFVSMGIPRKKPASFAAALAEGVHEEAREAHATVLGGDTSASSGPVFIDVSAVGEAARKGPVFRSGAKVGDFVYVSGALGGSARGLELLEGGFRPWSRRLWSRSLTAQAMKADEHRLDLLAALAHLLPKPRLALGRALGEHGLASAMTDVSDGLATDLHNICEASGVGAEIEMRALPIHASAAGTGRSSRAGRGSSREVGRGSSRKARSRAARSPDTPSREVLKRALTGGEDYELLFTVPGKKRAVLARLFANGDVPVTMIGRITSARNGVVLVGPGRERRILRRAGYEHFRSR